MVEANKQYSIEDVKAHLQLMSWWVKVCVAPIANKVTLYLANHTTVRPNQVTTVSIACRIISVVIFLQTTYPFMVLGSVFVYIAFMLDCVDGPLARLTLKASDFGRYFDHLSDLLGDILILSAIAYSSGLFFTPIVISMIFMHLAESYISYTSGFAIKENRGTSNFIFFKLFNYYRDWWFNKNLKSFLSFPDYTAFIFLLIPVLGAPEIGFQIGFYLLFIVVCYTILSTFVAIHTDIKQFP